MNEINRRAVSVIVAGVVCNIKYTVLLACMAFTNSLAQKLSRDSGFYAFCSRKNGFT